MQEKSQPKEEPSKKELEKSKDKKEEPKESEEKKIRSRSRSKSPEKKEEKEQKDLKEEIYTFPFEENKLIKIIFWNVCGLRALLPKKDLDKLITEENPDIICFNETKLDLEIIEKMKLKKLFKEKYNYISYFNNCKEKKGYSGTAILTKYKPLSVSYGMNIEKHDKEGRIITLDFDKFYLICCYVPNAGEGLKRLDYRVKEWDKDFFEYINNLKNKKDVILTGDLNVARENIDIFDPKGREKLPGFTLLEKNSFNNFLKSGYCDNFRSLHPNEKKFTFFTKRAKGAREGNKGWRLDYFVTNKDMKNITVKECDILDKEKYLASDHIPIKLEFNCKK